MSTSAGYAGVVTTLNPRPSRPRRKRAGSYHHGDLRRALLEQALRTVERSGVESLTLRNVGEALGVSRSALYRHFSSKDALVTAVVTEGFREMGDALAEAWTRDGRGGAGFEAMGIAYVRYAVAHPAHYRLMFGRVSRLDEDPALAEAATRAFQLLVDALEAQQREGLVRPDPAVWLAQFVWATMHGVASLAIDGRLPDDPTGDALAHYVVGRIRDAVRVTG